MGKCVFKLNNVVEDYGKIKTYLISQGLERWSFREIFYRFESMKEKLGLITTTPDDLKAYINLNSRITDAREKGLISDHNIIDMTRGKTGRGDYVFENPKDYVECSIDSINEEYGRSLWETQDIVPFVLIEKEAATGGLLQATDQLALYIYPVCGSTSRTFILEIAEDMRKVWKQNKEVKTFYFGDLNTPGLRIEESIQKRLSTELNLDVSKNWERLAVTPKQVKEYNLPKKVDLPTKRSGKNMISKAERYKDDEFWVELEALDPVVLRDLSKEHIESCIGNITAWNDRMKQNESERVELNKLFLRLRN